MAHPGSAADYRFHPVQSHKRPHRRYSAAVPRVPRPPESRENVLYRSPRKEKSSDVRKMLQNRAQSFDFGTY